MKVLSGKVKVLSEEQTVRRGNEPRSRPPGRGTICSRSLPRFRAVGRTGCARANAAAPTPPGASAWMLADASVDAGVWLSASTPSIDALANVDVDFPAAREMEKEYNRMLRGQRAASMRGGCTYPNHPPHPHHYPIIGFRPRAREGRLLRTLANSRHLSTRLKWCQIVNYIEHRN